MLSSVYAVLACVMWSLIECMDFGGDGLLLRRSKLIVLIRRGRRNLTLSWLVRTPPVLSEQCWGWVTNLLLLFMCGWNRRQVFGSFVWTDSHPNSRHF